MMSSKKIFFIFFLLLICVSQSGCALFALPGQIIGGLFGLAGKALAVADGLPKPPPWVFF